MTTKSAFFNAKTAKRIKRKITKLKGYYTIEEAAALLFIDRTTLMDRNKEATYEYLMNLPLKNKLILIESLGGSLRSYRNHLYYKSSLFDKYIIQYLARPNVMACQTDRYGFAATEPPVAMFDITTKLEAEQAGASIGKLIEVDGQPLKLVAVIKPSR